MKEQDLSKYIGKQQTSMIKSFVMGEEWGFFESKLAELRKIVNTMPATYETESVTCDDKVIWLHYFTSNCDWWIVERDISNVQHQAFGFARLHHGCEAELGYISLPEILACGAELDLHWTPKKWAEV